MVEINVVVIHSMIKLSEKTYLFKEFWMIVECETQI